MSTNASSPPPIEAFAFRIGGPIEFFVSGGINALVAWIVFYSNDVVHLVGWHSVLMVSGAMFFILPWATTITGFWSGVTQRRQGNFGTDWNEEASWFDRAVRLGLKRALISCFIGVAVILLINRLSPDLALGKWLYVALNGMVSGTLGYVLHIRAILQAGKLS